MKLSVCLMVRDEEKNLPRALDSVQGVADEVVVVDTGSVDRTIAIAEAFGARVFRHPWHDDFSEPHNFGWEQARGEWLLWLDGDESLDRNCIPHLRQCMEHPRVSAYYVQRQEIMDSDAPDRHTEMLMLRLMRRDLPARFTGKYHTQIILPARDCPPSQRWLATHSKVKLKHWRYKADTLLRARRGERIMSAELEADPGNLYLMVELANSYLDLNDDRAIDMRRQIVARLRPDDLHPPTVAIIYTLDRLLSHPEEAREASLTFDMVRSMALRWFPKSAPLRWALALRHFRDQQFEPAAAELTELIRLIETDELDKLVPFDPRVRDDALFNLAVCLIRLTRLDEAEKIFQQFHSHPTRAKAAAENLAVIAELRKLM